MLTARNIFQKIYNILYYIYFIVHLTTQVEADVCENLNVSVNAWLTNR